MIVEAARVIAIDGRYAVLRTQRRSACGSCTAKQGCGLPLLSRFFVNQSCRLHLKNHLNAEVGDIVDIGIPENGLLKSALVLYATPLLSVLFVLILAVLFLGSAITDVMAIGLSVIGFSFGMVCVKIWSNRVGQKPEYRSIILSVKTKNNVAEQTRLDQSV